MDEELTLLEEYHQVNEELDRKIKQGFGFRALQSLHDTASNLAGRIKSCHRGYRYLPVEGIDF